MVIVKSVEPRDNCFSINHIISWISSFLSKSYLSQLCPYTRYFVIIFLSACKIFSHQQIESSQEAHQKTVKREPQIPTMRVLSLEIHS